MKITNHGAWLLASTALFSGAFADAALAQTTAEPTNTLGEVVVTATRQTSTVNKVALSVTAVTAATLEKQGSKDLAELANTVPSVVFRRSGNEGNPSITIRGLGSALGAPTTAVYLDDTPIQKRDFGGLNTGNGTPYPQLFDLERVEFLRGPQGTLFGGSAEGGAVRFITPTPSLSRYSGMAKGEWSTMPGEGSPSYEAGFAIGGPIVQDKLGFRASLWQRHAGGYIDHVSMYDGHTISKDTNSANEKMIRLAVTWAPTANLKITPAIYWSQDHSDDSDNFWLDVPSYTTNSGFFLNKGTINGVAYDFPDQFYQGKTYPALKYGPYKSGVAVYNDEAGNARTFQSNRISTILLPTLTLDYDLPFMSVKSVTSYLKDVNKGFTAGSGGPTRTALFPITTNAGFVTVASHTGQNVGTPVTGGIGVPGLILPGFPTAWNENRYNNQRKFFVEELRFSSAPGEGRLSWVGGIYYSNTDAASDVGQRGTGAADNFNLRGINQAWLLGMTEISPGNNSVRSVRDKESEIAGFGEANYNLTSKLKLTAGVRVSQFNISYSQASGSAIQGAPPGYVGFAAGGTVTNVQCGLNPVSCNSATFHPFPNQPGDDSYTRFSGSQKSTPVTPKVGVSYQLNSRSLLYLTASQGYRTGGLNQPAAIPNCSPDLAAIGLTSTPATYNSDSVWSYEGGAKLGLLDGRMQVNTSLFHIDWKDPQLSIKLRCGQTYIQNAGSAVSQGADVQAQGRFGPFLIGGTVSYIDAHYTKTYALPGPSGTTVLIVSKGDSLGAPPWQYSLNGEYDFNVMGKYAAYLRADYAFSSQYQPGVGPGAVGYDPVLARGAATHLANMRAGVTRDTWEAAVFVKNLTQSQDLLTLNHAASSPLITSSTFRPREVGVSLAYRF